VASLQTTPARVYVNEAILLDALTGFLATACRGCPGFVGFEVGSSPERLTWDAPRTAKSEEEDPGCKARIPLFRTRPLRWIATGCDWSARRRSACLSSWRAGWTGTWPVRRAHARGLLAASVAVGLDVMTELMQAEVSALAGPKGRHNPARTAKRHGSERGTVTLGGRRVPVRRPRVRTVGDGAHELPVTSYEAFVSADLLADGVVARMLGGLSTRGYPVGLGPVGQQVQQAASGDLIHPTRPHSVRITQADCIDGTCSAVWFMSTAELHERIYAPHRQQRVRTGVCA
jgi:hypothetical protein